MRDVALREVRRLCVVRRLCRGFVRRGFTGVVEGRLRVLGASQRAVLHGLGEMGLGGLGFRRHRDRQVGHVFVGHVDTLMMIHS